MAVRDLLWGCPLCRAPGAIRPDGRRERCRECGAEFSRGRGSTIVARMDGSTRVRSARPGSAAKAMTAPKVSSGVAAAERRVNSPSTSSMGNRCSLYVAA